MLEPVNEGIKQHKNHPHWIVGKGLERSTVKSIVIYFSQTGNTEKVARAIQAGISQTTGQCDLQEMRDANPLRLKDYDLIGLGSPVIGQCPKNVLQFVRHLRFVGGKHAFSFCTHGTSAQGLLPPSFPGARGPGSHRHRLGRLVRATATSCTCRSPTRRRGIPTPSTSREALRRGLRTERWPCAACASGPGRPISYPRPLRPLLRPRLLQADAPHVVGSFSRLLKFDKEKCLYPSCTLCMDNCPMQGMDLSLDPPVLPSPASTASSAPGSALRAPSI